jgi:uncharacterized DUF497 family protein
MDEPVAGFEWDAGNREKCRKHGVSIAEIENLFADGVIVLPDAVHSGYEVRFRAVGKTRFGRHVFVVFTLRRSNGKRLVRPISARYMHRKEVEEYEEYYQEKDSDL